MSYEARTREAGKGEKDWGKIKVFIEQAKGYKEQTA